MDWPSQAIPEGYLSTSEQVVGRGVITPIQANEPLLATKLAGAGAGGGLAISIPDGMRAVSVRVDEVVAVAGFVTPGTRVDVLVTLNRLGAGREVTTRAVLQNVQVLAAGQSVERDRDGKPLTVTVITVLVAPAQAELLALASIEGRIQLALRPSLDTVQVVTAGASIQQLLGAAPPTRVAPDRRVRFLPAPTPEARATVVEGIQGGQRVLTTFGRDSRPSE
jgi:pilus assembly protein CpaB